MDEHRPLNAHPTPEPPDDDEEPARLIAHSMELTWNPASWPPMPVIAPGSGERHGTVAVRATQRIGTRTIRLTLDLDDLAQPQDREA